MIVTDENHAEALQLIDLLFDAVPDTLAGDILCELVDATVKYEDEKYPFEEAHDSPRVLCH